MKGKPQRDRQRHGGLADVLLLDGGRQPGRVDLLGLDAGVGQRFGVGLDHQVGASASQRSPNFEQPIPRMATLSRMPAGHRQALPSSGVDRRGFPKIPAEAALRIDILDAKHHAHRLADLAGRSASISVKSIIHRPPSSNSIMP